MTLEIITRSKAELVYIENYSTDFLKDVIVALSKTPEALRLLRHTTAVEDEDCIYQSVAYLLGNDYDEECLSSEVLARLGYRREE